MDSETSEIMADNNTSSGLVNTLIQKMSDNKNYVMIGLFIIGLAIASYYFFIKNVHETMNSVEPTVNTQMPGNNHPNCSNESLQNTLQKLDSIPVQNPSQSEFETLMQQHQMVVQHNAVLQQQLMMQQIRPQKEQASSIQLKHPNDDSDDIKQEVQRIQSNENTQIAQHNLTQNEIDDIHRKLNAMNQESTNE